MANKVNLFSARTIDGDSITITSDGKTKTVMAWGTWGGGTLQIQADADGTWINLPDAVFTSNGITNIYLAAGLRYRASLTGATSPNLNCRVV